MRVTVKREALESFIRKSLKENRTGHSTRIDTIPAQFDDTPVEPSAQMATQLSIEKPPVEDPDYIPSSLPELSRSAGAIVDEVPNDQIEYFYRMLHRILDSALDKSASISHSVGHGPVGQAALSEKIIRTHIGALLEQNNISVSDEGSDIHEPVKKTRRSPMPLISGTPASRALSHIMDYLFDDGNLEKYIKDSHDMKIRYGHERGDFLIRYSKNIEELPAIVDSILQDPAISNSKEITSLSSEGFSELRSLLSDYLSGFLKNPEGIESDVKLGNASKIIDEILKRLSKEAEDENRKEIDLEKFTSEFEAAKDAETDPEIALYIKMIGIKRAATLSEEGEIKDDMFDYEEEEEVDEENLAEIRAEVRVMMREEALASEWEPGKLTLTQPALRALMDKIAKALGTSTGNVRNIIYDDMIAMGMETDVLKKIFGIRRMPGGRDRIPLLYDPLKIKAKDAIVEKIYELFRYSLDLYLEGIAEEDLMREKFLGAEGVYKEGMNGYLRLQNNAGGFDVDVNATEFQDLRKAYEAIIVFIDEIAKEFVPEDTHRSAKEGGIRAFIADFKNAGVFDTVDAREVFDEFIAKKMKLMDSFKRDPDMLISMIDTSLRKSPARKDRYIKQIAKEKRTG